MMGVSCFFHHASANRCRRLLLLSSSSVRWKDCRVPWRTTRQTFTTTTTTYKDDDDDNDPTISSSSSNNPPSCLALIFDTETTHKVDFSKPYQHASQPDLVQLGMLLVDTHTWQSRLQVSLLVQPPPHASPEFIHPQAQAVHGISIDDCRRCGMPLKTALQAFAHAAAQADCLVAHNLKFDRIVLETALYRQQNNSNKEVRGHEQDTTSSSLSLEDGLEDYDDSSPFWNEMPQICTMQVATDVLKLPGRFSKRNYKWPTLEESFRHFAPSDADLPPAHDALGDAQACQTVLRGLWEQGLIDVETILLAKSKKNTAEKRKAAVNSATMAATANDVTTERVDEGHKATILATNDGNRPENNKTQTPVVPPPRPGELQLKLLDDDDDENSENGKFAVTGNTYKYKDSLKAEGARWDPNLKAWIFYDMDMLDIVQTRFSIKERGV